jgi:hypothetical protein
MCSLTSTLITPVDSRPDVATVNDT